MNAESNPLDAIESLLVAYLRPSGLSASEFDANTDLIESGRLDSLLVMDLVSFVEARFQIRMQPTDITPRNLRSAKSLARYILQATPAADRLPAP